MTIGLEHREEIDVSELAKAPYDIVQSDAGSRHRGPREFLDHGQDLHPFVPLRKDDDDHSPIVEGLPCQPVHNRTTFRRCCEL
jgi:hypothetical protein